MIYVTIETEDWVGAVVGRREGMGEWDICEYETSLFIFSQFSPPNLVFYLLFSLALSENRVLWEYTK